MLEVLHLRSLGRSRPVKDPFHSQSYCSIPLKFLTNALLHYSLNGLLGLVHMGVPRPMTHWCQQVPSFEPQETIKVSIISIKVKSWLFLCKKISQVMLRVGSAFFAQPNSQHKFLSPTSKKQILPCRHPCHTWDFGLQTPCEMASPTFLPLEILNCTNWPQVNYTIYGIQCHLLSMVTQCHNYFLRM